VSGRERWLDQLAARIDRLSVPEVASKEPEILYVTVGHPDFGTLAEVAEWERRRAVPFPEPMGQGLCVRVRYAAWPRPKIVPDDPARAPWYAPRSAVPASDRPVSRVPDAPAGQADQPAGPKRIEIVPAEWWNQPPAADKRERQEVWSL